MNGEPPQTGALPAEQQQILAAAVADLAARVEQLAAELERVSLVRPEPVGGSSRKVGRGWSRVGDGLEARLLSFGGTGDGAWAWVDVRPERAPGQETLL